SISLRFGRSSRRSTLSRSGIAFAFALALSVQTIAPADPRPFTFSTDTYPVGKGQWEYEQWVTWSTQKESNSGFQRLEFRHEFEFGIADNFDLAFYVPVWRYEDADGLAGTRFGSVGMEGVVYLSNPVTNFVGLGLYGEVQVGEDSLTFEN